MDATNFLSVKSQNAVQSFQSFHEFFLFFLSVVCTGVVHFNLAMPIRSLRLEPTICCCKAITNGLSRLLHNSFADCAARAKGCNGGQETQLLPFVVPRLVFTSFLCPVHSCATALQLHCCLCSALWFLYCFSRQKIRSLDVVSRMFSNKCQLI